jgi:hypothetical protein
MFKTGHFKRSVSDTNFQSIFNFRHPADLGGFDPADLFLIKNPAYFCDFVDLSIRRNKLVN